MIFKPKFVYEGNIFCEINKKQEPAINRKTVDR